jgi:hypothetical protein
VTIHSTIDLALISPSCSIGSSCGTSKIRDLIDTSRKTHILDPIHIIHISPFIVLPSRSSLHPGQQTTTHVFLFKSVTQQEVWPTRTRSCARSLPTAALSHISLSHSTFSGPSLGTGQPFEFLRIVDTSVRVFIKGFVCSIVATELIKIFRR